MILDNDETCILNETLETEDNRDSFLQRLEEYKKNTMGDIQRSVGSLIEKISNVSDEEFAKIKKDHDEKQIFTYPPYVI